MNPVGVPSAIAPKDLRPSSATMGRLLLLACFGALGPLAAADTEATLTLPSNLPLAQATSLIAEATGLRLLHDPQRLQGSLGLSRSETLSLRTAWALYNRALLGQGLATVATETAATYQVLPITEAIQICPVLDLADLRQQAYPPSVLSAHLHTQYLPAEQAAQVLGAGPSLGSGAQVRATDNASIIVTGTLLQVERLATLLANLDRPGAVPTIRTLTPSRADPRALATAAQQGWASLNRLRGSEAPLDLQVAPDGRRLIVIAPTERMDEIEALIRDLDDAEPKVTRTYRPKWFALEAVRDLISQLMQDEQASMELVSDRLTGSLIVRASEAQQARVDAILDRLDETPAASRQQARTFQVKHRNASDMAKLLTQLLDLGFATPSQTAVASATAAAAQAQSGSTAEGSRAGTLVLTADDYTNRLLCLGDPRQLEEVARLLSELDQRQPQVQLDVTLVSLSASQNRELGVELIGQASRNEVSATVMSLFGLSTVPPATPTAPTVSAPAGLTGLVLNPGDYAGVVRALETVSNGHSLITSNIVINNNAKADIQGVIQEPITAINSGEQVATTTYSGTSDAGTKLSLEPVIAAGDHITLTYVISQSAFLGSPTVTADGVSIPPTRRADEIASVATIPDGFVIALGGLANRTEKDGESRLPWIGSVPLLGNLFKQQSRGSSDSRFYVFIKATILRDRNFRDLRLLRERSETDAKDLGPSTPRLTPERMR